MASTDILVQVLSSPALSVFFKDIKTVMISVLFSSFSLVLCFFFLLTVVFTFIIFATVQLIGSKNKEFGEFLKR